MFQATLGLRGQLTARKRNSNSFTANIWLWKIKQFLMYGWRELPLLLLVTCMPVLRLFVPGMFLTHGRLYARIIRGDGSVENIGYIGCHLVTTAGKAFLAGCFDNTNEAETLRYHGFGTGTTAAAAGDTGLQTELTTQYTVDSTRLTGTQGKSGATYTTVATITPDSGGTIAVTEWGLFSAATSGTIFDRQVFAAFNLNSANGDAMQTTYVLTLS